MSAAAAQMIATPATMPPDMMDIPADMLDMPLDEIENDHVEGNPPIERDTRPQR